MAFYTPEQDENGLSHPENARQGIPDVLLIGDSISIGYTDPVRRRLTECCNIYRPDANCGDTKNGLVNIHSWLGDRVWDLIHFNWGLHDLCYRHPEATVYGNRDKVNGSISVEPAAYKANLEKLVEIMQHQARQLVWASTTYIPDGEAGRHQGDEEHYNALAAEIMETNRIPTDDLYEITQAFSSEMFICSGDVHYTRDGYNQIAEAVSQCIREQLTK